MLKCNLNIVNSFSSGKAGFRDSMEKEMGKNSFTSAIEEEKNPNSGQVRIVNNKSAFQY